MKFIDVTESGSNLKKAVNADKIKTLESLTYRTGQEVTVITFIDNSPELHALESMASIRQQLS